MHHLWMYLCLKYETMEENMSFRPGNQWSSEIKLLISPTSTCQHDPAGANDFHHLTNIFLICCVCIGSYDCLLVIWSHTLSTGILDGSASCERLDHSYSLFVFLCVCLWLTGFFLIFYIENILIIDTHRTDRRQERQMQLRKTYLTSLCNLLAGTGFCRESSKTKIATSYKVQGIVENYNRPRPEVRCHMEEDDLHHHW